LDDYEIRKRKLIVAVIKPVLGRRGPEVNQGLELDPELYQDLVPEQMDRQLVPKALGALLVVVLLDQGLVLGLLEALCFLLILMVLSIL
jgi:hypothetical protein